eukprot:s1257_g23.t1
MSIFSGLIMTQVPPISGVPTLILLPRKAAIRDSVGFEQVLRAGQPAREEGLGGLDRPGRPETVPGTRGCCDVRCDWDGIAATSSTAERLMSEAQVKAMLRRQRDKNSSTSSSARRVQRELEEWQTIKDEKLARLGNQKDSQW